MPAIGNWVKAKLGILDRFVTDQETINDQQELLNNQVLPIQGNAGYHNSIYRGKDLGTNVTDEMYASITAGTFDDMFVGDYFTINSTVYRIAGFNLIKNCGDNVNVGNNVCLVPDRALANAKMNESNDTTGAYANSLMRTANMTQITRKIETDFGSTHVIPYRDMLTNATADGQASGVGVYDCKVELMSEVMVYGTKVWGNTGYEVGCLSEQIPLFRLNPESIHRRFAYWLRSVASTTNFSAMIGSGYTTTSYASAEYGVIPFFFIAENASSAVTIDDVEDK